MKNVRVDDLLESHTKEELTTVLSELKATKRRLQEDWGIPVSPSTQREIDAYEAALEQA